MAVLVAQAELLWAAGRHALGQGGNAGLEGVLGALLLQPGQRSRLQSVSLEHGCHLNPSGCSMPDTRLSHEGGLGALILWPGQLPCLQLVPSAHGCHILLWPAACPAYSFHMKGCWCSAPAAWPFPLPAGLHAESLPHGMMLVLAGPCWLGVSLKYSFPGVALKPD